MGLASAVGPQAVWRRPSETPATAQQGEAARAVVRQARELANADLAELQKERRGLERDLARYHAELRKLAGHKPGQIAARVADRQELVAAAEARLGEVVSSSLENSNVDLSTEFVQMIMTQKGFDANSKVITTSDQVVQTALQMKK